MEKSQDKELEDIAAVFSALGNPLRLKILSIVSASDRPLHIKAVAKITKTRYTLAYKHVKTLEKAGLITIYEVGRSRVIALKSPTLFEKAVALGQELIAIK
ncbi:MAG: winged helix-turn-helix domain-containing protein [Candidatus Caldarchaeum sp.]